MENIFETLASITNPNNGLVVSSQIDKLISKRNKLETILNKEDDLKKSFYGGMVGFKNGSNKKKWENKISKELDLSKELELVKAKIQKLQNPLKAKKSIELNPNIFKVGDFAFETFNNKVEIIKINTKTVTVKYQSGFKETIKPHLLKKILCKDNQ
jgi:hypothetical protein